MKSGYNTAFTFSTIFERNSNELKFADFINKQNEKIDLLRFSGGTLSFDYDISADGYGNKETNKYLPTVNFKNYIYKYILFVQLLKHTPKTVYCLNLHPLFKDITKIDNCLLPLKELVRILGHENIYAVELGNESFMYFSNKKKQYFTICNLLINEIRKIAPNALISAPTEGCNSKRGNEWNKMVNRLPIDAISPHFYVNDLNLLDKEFIGKVSILENGKYLRMNHKVICTEYNYKFVDGTAKSIPKETSQKIVKKMDQKAVEMNFDSMLYHSLLQESKNVYSKFVLSNDYALR
jgi:hypothetical protein